MPSTQNEPIALVGSSCRFPGGANTPSELWKLLENPRDVCENISADRFDTEGFYHPDSKHHGATNVRHAYLLKEDIRLFDASFFNISPNEADAMDPQQRLLLEVVYEALEAGGHSVKTLRGSNTAVFTGTMDVDWNVTGMRDVNTLPTYFATGVNRAIISNRVSYFFDWHGPSMTIDTACSSSLIAVHQGVKALRTGESRVAVACGTNIILNPETFILESKLKMLSPTGRSRMWDADADGYARGEGVTAVVMKRLSDAIADGDHIQCIIRETGTNQDGFSNGITVPSTEAQTALIQQTYALAGLDPANKPWDRPQFFEAHGTGTKAGDPKEAAAIHQAFGKHSNAETGPLFVGSIKTVIGHLEGSAGLAGLLKGAASIESGLIAPNLLFNRLNPDIEPFYKGLHVPTELVPWPTLPAGVPRRVSVNSFGFGGSNAHAILEEYVPETTAHALIKTSSANSTPVLFSAASEASLVAQLQVYSGFLKAHPEIDLADLAWTLQARRSQFSYKIAFAASSIEQLTTKIDAKLAAVAATPGTTIGLRALAGASAAQPKIMGVFTGQGAQWAAMGALLYPTSDLVRNTLNELERSLDTLPSHLRPEWKLVEELLKPAETSRIAEAALSQPLCTAIQVALVELLRAAGVTFSAVVGHSSGEIGAAYAAGFVSAGDAIRIAYLRGLFAKLAGSNGQKGAMLAVGTSWEDAEDVTSLPDLEGRVAIAAHNSAASVTLSGDADAVAHAKKIFDEEKKFARMLKVDTAYHSHHMLPCGDPYVAAMRECGVRVNKERAGKDGCAWFSSVVPSESAMAAVDEVSDEYWRDNMTRPVLFADAVKNAVASDSQIGLVIEVGPHPALKGPASQTISDVRSAALPYTGVLSRGANDVEAFSDALGFLWTQLGTSGVDFATYGKAMSGDSAKPELVVGLPSYQWSHGRSHWSESRRSKRWRGAKMGPHELLGTITPESGANDMRWSNVLKMSEVPWLSGHQLQGQTVFPAAGYIAMAIEASRALSAGKEVELFELHDLTFGKAMTFEEGDENGVETTVALTDVKHHGNGTATANFACYGLKVVNVGSTQEMDVMATGTVKVMFGKPSVDALVSEPAEEYNTVPVDSERLYGSLSKLGYDYSGSFRTMSAAKRRLGYVTGEVGSYEYAVGEMPQPYLIHPSTLDVAFHAGLLAYSAPGDNRLWSLHVPTSIRTIRLNPTVCSALPTSGAQVPVIAMIDNSAEGIATSIDLLSEDGKNTMIQVESLTLKAFAPATKAEDRVMFTTVKLGLAGPDGAALAQGIKPTPAQRELALAGERLAYYYIRKWDAELSDEEWLNGQSHHIHMRDWVRMTIDAGESGTHLTLRPEWSDDTAEDIEALVAQFPDSIDLKMGQAVGENMVAAVRGETTVLEHMVKDNMLDDFYKEGTGFKKYNEFLAGMMKQIVHRYPLANIFEIGAGTGGATKHVLKEIGQSVSSYTYTDISLGFFPKAAEIFKDHSDKMVFKVFDAEKTPASQGYKENSYDIVIASNVLHATESLHNTLVNTRKLLKPGGFLFLLEVTDNEPIRTNFALGPISGWWLGVDDGRRWAPTISPGKWHSALRKAGFSGVDAVTPEIDRVTWPFSIMGAQAVDDRVNFLRGPLATPRESVKLDIESLVILGGQTLETARITEQVTTYLKPYCQDIIVLDGLPTEDEALDLPPMSTFINLVDLDSPIFRNFDAEKHGGLQRILELGKCILWITQGAMIDQPYHNASIAFGRTVRREAEPISLNHLDIADIANSNTPKLIAEHLLQMCALDEWEEEVRNTGADAQLSQQLLWSKESEAYHGATTTTSGPGTNLLLPRLLNNDSQNDRLNSWRRDVTKSVPVTNSNVQVVPPTANGAPAALVESASLHGQQDSGASSGLVQVETSSLMPISVLPDTFLFLGVSKDSGSIFLSTKNSREAAPVASLQVPKNMSQIAGALLISTMSELLAMSLVDSLAPGSKLWIHASATDSLLIAALTRLASAKNITLTISCDADATSTKTTSWIKLSAGSPRHRLRATMASSKSTHFLDLTAANFTHQQSELSLRMSEVLPTTCKTISSSRLFQHQPSMPYQSNEAVVVNRLQEAFSNAAAVTVAQAQIDDLVFPVSHIQDLANVKEYTYNSALTWPTAGSLDVQVRGIDGSGFFSKDKTYLLVGLSGKIGQSFTEWMVANGAGCVCLTSRNPKVDDRWVQSLAEIGGTVKVFSMDATKLRSVRNVVKEIRQSCPPIAGVVNGAMVLEDMLFSKMPAESMTKVLGPKIDGSNNLDIVFRDDALDFFVLLSSAVCVFGNIGQSNYCAANGYLNSLARQRRRRGVAASALDIGQVSGIGYIEAAGRDNVMDQLTALGLDPVSETDLRQAFAEAIRGGHPDPVNDTAGIPDAVLTTGIRCFGTDEGVKGPWFSNPFFWHRVIESKTAEVEDEAGGKKRSLPAARRLAKAANKEEALEILKECFEAKLRVILQLADQVVDHSSPLAELGIDSLVAVEVRSWFLKEVKVDIPVLKVVGGASLAELCELALGKLPEDMFAGAGKDESDAKVDAAKTEPVAVPQSRSSKGSSPADSPTPGTPLFTPQNMSGSNTEASTRSVSPVPGEPKSSAGSKQVIGPKHTSLDYFPTKPVPVILEPTPAPPAPKAARPRRFLKSVPISLSQSRFWFLQQLLANQKTHNVAYYYNVEGHLNIPDLERAVRVVASRHESLRTCFIADEDDPAQGYQKVLPSSPIRLECKTIASESEVTTELSKLRSEYLDLESGYLLRLVLLTLNPTTHYLLMYHHHIIMDGVSLEVFLYDLEKAYNGQSLGAAPRQYPEYSATQRQAWADGDMAKEMAYWRSVFPAGEQPPVLPLLPMSKTSSRVAMSEFDTHQVGHLLDPVLAAKIRAVSKTQGSTPFHFYLAAFKAMLFRFAPETDDLTIGLADAARNDDTVMGSIGFFLNLLALRFRRNQDQTFKEAMVEARKTAHAALDSSRLPFDVLLSELGVGRDSTHAPIFQAFLDYRQGMQPKRTFGNCEFEMQDEVHTGKTAYDVSADVTDSEHGTMIFIRVQKSIYDMTAGQLLMDTYVHFLETLAHDPLLPLKDIPLFSETQLASAAHIGRGPKLVSTWPETLPRRIDQVAQVNHDKIALMDGITKPLTYSAMMGRIEAIAESLTDAGVVPGQRVLVYQTASSDWPCSMLAIMRIGAIYVPLDLRNPVSRLSVVAKDSEPAAILADHTTVDDAPQLEVPGAKLVNVTELGARASTYIPDVSKANSVAAYLYTSGSTGTPKGIAVTHAGLKNEIEGYTKMWDLGRLNVLQQSAYTFNHSSDQIYTALVNGGMVYTVPWDKRGNPLEIVDIMVDGKINYTKATPSEYALWMQHGGQKLSQATTWQRAFGGGEPLSITVAEAFASLELPDLRLFNSYGPTEISISSTKMELMYKDTEAIRNSFPIPCGFSLPNYHKYIVDKDLRPLPAGMPGELCIGGAGVSRGYIKNEQLTSTVFVPNPFATEEDIANGWTRMYRTGDICHLNSDGSMVFHNRIAGDTQVKIRGLRIELSDIESNIIATSKGVIRDAVVTLREGDPENFLVAHVLFADQHDSGNGDQEAFLDRLLSSLPLPQYMVPVVLIPLASFPLTSHSKVNRKEIQKMPLPKRDNNTKGGGNDDDDTNHESETIVQMRTLWREVLGKSIEDLGLSIKPTTSFFLIGGNSLLVIRLQSRIRQALGVAVPLIGLLGSNTLESMARKVEETASVSAIDWAKETVLPTIEPEFLAAVNALIPSPSTPSTGKTILLTGATGSLASHLLPSLLSNPSVSAIHCLAVRNASKFPETIASHPKITTHPGDLSTPLLGLQPHDFASLAATADVILHLGGARSFWDAYHVMRPSSVNPMRDIVKLATPRRVPVHYVSTAGVLGSGAGEVSAAGNVPASDGSNGYVASRWASERILEKASEEFGVPGGVYRFLPATDGTMDEKLVEEFVRVVDETGCVPDARGMSGRMDLISTGELSEFLGGAVLVSGDEKRAGVEFTHYSSRVAVPGQALMDVLEERGRRAGENGLKLAPFLEWVGRIKKKDFGYFLSSYEFSIEKEGGKGDRLQLGR